MGTPSGQRPFSQVPLPSFSSATSSQAATLQVKRPLAGPTPPRRPQFSPAPSAAPAPAPLPPQTRHDHLDLQHRSAGEDHSSRHLPECSYQLSKVT